MIDPCKILRLRPEGLYCPAGDFFVDPHRPVGRAVVTHGHAVHRSKRHKSGVAMRFPRIHRIRWDKPHTEADRVETLAAWIGG